MGSIPPVDPFSYVRSNQCSTADVTKNVNVLPCHWAGADRKHLVDISKEQRVSSLVTAVVLNHMFNII